MTSMAASFLRLLNYKLTYPLAPSFLLVQIVRFKNATTDTLVLKKCCCQTNHHACQCAANILKREAAAFEEAAGILFAMRCVCAVGILIAVGFCALGAERIDSGLPLSYGMSLFLYFSLHLILSVQNKYEPAHLLTMGAFTHLTLWVLHCFTFTIVTASTLSFLVYPSAAVASTNATGVLTVIVCSAMATEVLMSAWRIHGWLVVATGVWSLSIAILVVAFKTNLPSDAPSVHDAVESAFAGLKLITFSFTAVWIVGLMRDYAFSPVCNVTTCCCKNAEDGAGGEITFAHVTELEKQVLGSMEVVEKYALL
ncbi:hypothetical protein HDU98_011173 [Podochytrium sp. JEL0797]|nr:hypothetical protein HDU98_011173 [Podochytrium sp. JEL0797]